MEFNFHTVNLKKKFPLQISRGTHDKSQNLFVEIMENDKREIIVKDNFWS